MEYLEIGKCYKQHKKEVVFINNENNEKFTKYDLFLLSRPEELEVTLNFLNKVQILDDEFGFSVDLDLDSEFHLNSDLEDILDILEEKIENPEDITKSVLSGYKKVNRNIDDWNNWLNSLKKEETKNELFFRLDRLELLVYNDSNEEVLEKITTSDERFRENGEYMKNVFSIEGFTFSSLEAQIKYFQGIDVYDVSDFMELTIEEKNKFLKELEAEDA